MFLKWIIGEGLGQGVGKPQDDGKMSLGSNITVLSSP